MTKSELVSSLIAVNTSLSANLVEEGVNEILEQITATLESGERVEIRGFGSFSLRERDERIGRNPKNGECVKLDAKMVPHFKAGKKLKECVDLV